MESPPSSIVRWAQQLLAMETGGKAGGDARGHEAQRVLEKLRIALTQFVGADGFTALLRRALALARADVPSLQTATVTKDGRLVGVAATGNSASDIEAATAITAYLLGLLITFIGEPLTFRLIREIWPDESFRTTKEFEDLK